MDSSSELDSFLVLQDKTGKESWLRTTTARRGPEFPLAVAPPADDTYVVFAASLEKTGKFALKVALIAHADDGKETLAKRPANAAVALLRMNRPEKVWPLLKHSPDPRVRSYLIHRFAPLGADAAEIIQRFADEPDLTIRRALVLSLGDYADGALSAEARQAFAGTLEDVYRRDSDPGLHAAAEWLLRTWKQEAWLTRTNEEWAKAKESDADRLEALRKSSAKGPQWYVNGQGQTMVVIPGPVEFLMGSPPTEADRRNDESRHLRRIGRSFAIAAKAVTMEQYRKFSRSYDLGEAKYHRMADLPVVGTSWHQAAAYCNWLSEKEGIAEDQWVYEMNVRGEVAKLKTDYLSLTGYRLPTEAEMEYATRAGARDQPLLRGNGRAAAEIRMVYEKLPGEDLAGG